MNTPQTTVRDIATEQLASIRVFEKFGIDYCCGGRKPLAEACRERSLDPQAVLAAIESAAELRPGTTPDWATAQLRALCRYIVATHHDYVRIELHRLQQLAHKVVARHGDTHPELLRIQQRIEAVGEELLQHMAKEEMVLFPYISNLEQNMETCGPRSLSCFGTVRNPIRAMMEEHDAASETLGEIRELSGNYTLPEGACPTYRSFYQSLSAFEMDLYRHVHLENNILFPRAIELEQSCG